MKFKNKRYITKGVNERVPLLTQLFMWHCIDTLDVPKDYLQVFKCSGYDGKQKIIHIQEEPEYERGLLQMSIFEMLICSALLFLHKNSTQP